MRCILTAQAQVSRGPASSSPSPSPSPSSPKPAEPVQVIVYGPGEPEVVEGTATTLPDGTLVLDLPIDAPPREGTTVQLILYHEGAPDVVEGRTGPPRLDGSFDILPIS